MVYAFSDYLRNPKTLKWHEDIILDIFYDHIILIFTQTSTVNLKLMHLDGGLRSHFLHIDIWLSCDYIKKSFFISVQCKFCQSMCLYMCRSFYSILFNVSLFFYSVWVPHCLIHYKFKISHNIGLYKSSNIVIFSIALPILKFCINFGVSLLTSWEKFLKVWICLIESLSFWQ